VEIAAATGGQIASVCQSDLLAALQSILWTIPPSSHFQLVHRPISATLSVAKDGAVLERSRSEGYFYLAITNSIALTPPIWELNVTSELVIGYERWVTP
jgi:hypothetical protein